MQVNGRTKERACRVALLKLESLGFLELPRKKVSNGGKPPRIVEFQESDNALASMPASILLHEVCNSNDARLWNSSIAAHHYLGLPTPVGRLIRYLVFSDENLVASISFSEPAWNVAARSVALDEIGSPDSTQLEVVANNRFMILPHVKVKNIASRILSLAEKRIAENWNRKYGVVPEIIETFVDPTRFHGTCYKAANWVFVGYTKGYSKSGASHKKCVSRKMLFLRGLTKKINSELRSKFLSAKSRPTKHSDNVGDPRPSRRAA